MNKVPSWTLGRTMLSQPVPGGTVGQSTSLGTNTSLGLGQLQCPVRHPAHAQIGTV